MLPPACTSGVTGQAAGPSSSSMRFVLAAGLTACGSRPAHGNQAASRHRPAHAILAAPAAAVSGHRLGRPSAVFQTTRTFQLGAGHATRTFTFGEQSGVIVRNQLTVRHGVRVVVDPRIPDVADATVWSWAARTDPSLSCRRDGA